MTAPSKSTIAVAGRRIGAGYPVFIIAEIGINHSGDEALCAEMVVAAANAGADAVKLQTVTPEASYHPDTESFQVFRDAVLDQESMVRLGELARQNNIILFSTPGDPPALRMLQELAHPAIKISSGLMTNLPLIRMAAGLGVPLIISTGMAELDEVDNAISVARDSGAKEIAVLQCTSLYPAPAETLNLRVMASLEARFGIPVGYSDHHDGQLACVAAVSAGAKIIEKHFTSDCSLPGADHALSLDADAFADMVQSIRKVESMLGNADKRPDAAELPLRDGRHRRLVVARDMEAGENIRAEDILLMRLPADSPGLAAKRYEEVIGKRLKTGASHLSGLTDDMIEDIN